MKETLSGEFPAPDLTRAWSCDDDEMSRVVADGDPRAFTALVLSRNEGVVAEPIQPDEDMLDWLRTMGLSAVADFLTKNK